MTTTTTPKIDGIKDDLDVVGIVKAFENFRDAIQLVSDQAEQMVVDLDFDSTYNKSTHYTFKQDEIIQLNGVKINPENKKIAFCALFAATDKYFYNDEAELINVETRDTVTGDATKKPLNEHIKESFAQAFPAEVKINSLVALQAMIKNNPGLVDVLNEPSKFLDDIEKVGARGKAYVKLEKFGRY